jgi:predicted acylesterase/phospholipase RssA
MSILSNINTDTVRKIINRALDDVEAIDIHYYTSAIYSSLTFQWVQPEWFEWRSHYVPLVFIMIFFWPVFATLIMAFTAASTWLFWILTSLIFGVLQLGYVMYQFVMIFSDILILSLFKTYSMLRSQLIHYMEKSGLRDGQRSRQSGRRIWKTKLAQAGTYENFLKIAVLDTTLVKRSSVAKRRPSLTSIMMMRSTSFDGSPSRQKQIPRNKSFDARYDENLIVALEKDQDDGWLKDELGKTGEILLTTTGRLREARMQASSEGTSEAAHSLKYLLSGVVKRNHLLLDELSEQNARSVADTGKFGLSQEARTLIRAYYEEVQKGLDWIADSPLDLDKKEALNFAHVGLMRPGEDPAVDERARQTELNDRCTLVRKMKQNMGRTALMLSGGGAQAMYHLGTIRALIESKLYDDMKVISGTSGGSITAAMCALRTADELYNHVCVSNVSTDFMLTGEMKKKNIRWFPTVMEMGAYWLKHSLLVDSGDFKRCCDFYYGDTTFEEAFERTCKHVCITVSASRATGGTAQRLLLNHISTPHVTLASAVAASCALPGVMAPAKLLAKDSTGKQEPFEVDGVEWIDGSVQADLPFERISTLFNVSNYVVCQTNFHVMPFLNKAHHPNSRSLYWRLFQTVEWDIRSRALKLSRLGLFPRIFGQDISKVFKQKYHGNLTLVPRFTAMQTFGLKALANPTKSDMENYLTHGQIAAWPYLTVIADMIRLERGLDDCLARLQDQRRVLIPDWDDVESLTSAPSMSKGVRFLGSGREADRLKQKVMKLERENFSLKMKLEEIQHKLGEPDLNCETKENTEILSRSASAGNLVLSEREVWSLIKLKNRS